MYQQSQTSYRIVFLIQDRSKSGQYVIFMKAHVILSDFPCAYCLIIVLKQSVKDTYVRENQTHSKCELLKI